MMVWLAALAGPVQAQSAAAPAVPASAASAPGAAPQRVEIRGSAIGDSEARRQSTAAKIVIGREQIEAYGDTTVGEVLRRLPGVTSAGAPGRGGPPRMRGLGAGYTQFLLDGQRVPPGFSIESLTPEQIERIEILRAPTAETGARAIGGTINIITREGFTKKLNDVRLGLSLENGRVQPNLGWTRNDSAGNFIYNLSTSLYQGNRESHTRSSTTEQDLASAVFTRDETLDSRSVERRAGINVTGRLQWRNEAGTTLLLMPIFFFGEGNTRRFHALDQRLPATAPRFDHASDDGAGHFGMARLNGQWAFRLGDMRLEWRGGMGLLDGANHNLHLEFDRNNVQSLAMTEVNRFREPSLTMNLKASQFSAGEHQLVGGAEIDASRRNDSRETALNNVPQLTDFGDTFSARALRTALYAQDEWKIGTQWAAHAGLRWEGITTRGEALDGTPQTNRSSVWTPLLHAVWKPDEKSRDQLRLSLTRSYRSPTLQNLISRPRVVIDWRNSETQADTAGNPDLRPELATGIDVAVERYLGAGGVLSANVFARRIKDLMRSTITLESVPWSATPRWVSRPKNVGGAFTSGVELEAKFRLTEVFEQAPPLDVRSNLSLFRSRVDGVPGPDNRLDQQPPGMLNLGLDYRLRNGWPLTLGGNFNYTPGYRTQITAEQSLDVSRKRVVDLNVLWAMQPGAHLRLTASNFKPLDHETVRGVRSAGVEEIADTINRSYLNLGLRLELKL